MASSYAPNTVRVNATADGDNTVVAARAGKRIRVTAYNLQAFGTIGTISVKSGAATILAEFANAAGAAIPFTGDQDTPAFETALAEALVINNTAAQDVRGHITYVFV